MLKHKNAMVTYFIQKKIYYQIDGIVWDIVILISFESRMQAPIHQQVQLESKPSYRYLLTFESASLRLLQYLLAPQVRCFALSLNFCCD